MLSFPRPQPPQGTCGWISYPNPIPIPIGADPVHPQSELEA